MNYRQFIYRQMWSVYDFISFDRITQTRFLDFSFFVTETLPEYVEVERFIKESVDTITTPVPPRRKR